jgi:dipeptidyl aminopeptidase/acylaminoacyl peptidase
VKPPLQIQDLFRQQIPESPVWSPDGRRIVYTVAYQDRQANARGSCLRLFELAAERDIALTSGRTADGRPCSESMPRWSPDGSRIAFLSNRSGDMAVWIAPADGGEPQRLTSPDCGCGVIMADAFYGGLDWSPDGHRLVFTAQLRHHVGPDDRGGIVVGIDHGETYGHVNERIHLWSIAETGGPAAQLTEGDFDYGDPRWSPDGASIACVSNQSGDEGAVSHSVNRNYDLWLIPAKGGPARRLTTNPGPDWRPRWSPDGRYIAYMADERCGPHRDHHSLWVLELATGKTTRLTSENCAVPDDLPIQPWMPDSKRLMFCGWQGTQSQIFGAPEDGHGGTNGIQVYGPPSINPAKDGYAAVMQTSRDLPELEVYLDVKRRWGSGHNRWLDERSLGRVDVVSWKNEGFTIEGHLTLPPDYEEGRRYPTLLFSHGGPHSRLTCGLHLEWHFQFLAAKGYVVLAPNYRGSAGYVRQFLEANRMDWGGGDTRDLLAGVDYLVDRGIADPSRLGMYGGSYGGYQTCWTITQDHRFRAAVARAPITNLVSYYGTTDLQTLTGWDLGGTPWEQPELYRQRSPITHAPEVRTPLLLLHGEADRRVPYSQSEEFYTALKSHGKTVELVKYPGEGHLILKPSHTEDYFLRTLAWFDRYLKPE